VNGWKIGPRGEVSLSYLAFDGYNEYGAQSLNLAVNSYKTTYLEGGAGLFIGKRFKNFIATSKVMGMCGGMMGNNLSGHFLTYGSPYYVNAGHMTTSWVTPEATLAWNLSKGVMVSANYTGRFGNNYSENTGSVGLNLYW
jgi:uncharacterized protein with beta-barrel porin domain